MTKNKEYCQIFDNGWDKTVFTPHYRSCALNLTDPRIAEGFRTSLETFRLMRERAKGANAEFLVLLLPTKELVFKDAVYRNSTNLPEVYKSLIEHEELVWQKSKDFFKKEDISFINALPTLRKYLDSGNQPYPITTGGHCNVTGHQAIAELVYSEIIKQNFLN